MSLTVLQCKEKKTYNDLSNKIIGKHNWKIQLSNFGFQAKLDLEG